MKFLMLILALFSQVVFADDCRLEQVSQMTTERKVGAVTDLVKNKSQNKCQVKFRVNVDGEWHTVNWTHSDYYQEEVLCQMAVRHGMNELMLKLPGNFQAESRMICKNGSKPRRLAKGDEGLETEFGKDPGYPQYFKVGNVSKCRKFKDVYVSNSLQKVTGVICQNQDEQLWTVIDTF